MSNQPYTHLFRGEMKKAVKRAIDAGCTFDKTRKGFLVRAPEGHVIGSIHKTGSNHFGAKYFASDLRKHGINI